MCFRSSKSTKIDINTSITWTIIFRRTTHAKWSTWYTIRTRLLSFWPTTRSSDYFSRTARICSTASKRTHATTTSGFHDCTHYRSIYGSTTNLAPAHSSASACTHYSTIRSSSTISTAIELRFSNTPPGNQYILPIVSPSCPAITTGRYQRSTAINRRTTILSTRSKAY
jgi:hypothetical protein